jgi:hypothetical protein
MRWAGPVAGMGVLRNSYIMLVGKPKGRRPFGRDNIRMVLGE